MLQPRATNPALFSGGHTSLLVHKAALRIQFQEYAESCAKWVDCHLLSFYEQERYLLPAVTVETGLPSFLAANAKCWWTGALAAATTELKYAGYVAPGVLLVAGAARALETVRGAYARSVLKPPPTYLICGLGRSDMVDYGYSNKYQGNRALLGVLELNVDSNRVRPSHNSIYLSSRLGLKLAGAVTRERALLTRIEFTRARTVKVGARPQTGPILLFEAQNQRFNLTKAKLVNLFIQAEYLIAEYSGSRTTILITVPPAFFGT
ncbi:Storkhead-box protein 1 [Eumeta japonica]|uniref:Storkhead-box protein 1 n=1 Tax=Eumeta variegata TaxID=151549 RepID=A0A4C1T7F7_EUMVA|nr:Storkhead-box protein 1 [Eumeta japonica]